MKFVPVISLCMNTWMFGTILPHNNYNNNNEVLGHLMNRKYQRSLNKAAKQFYTKNSHHENGTEQMNMAVEKL